MAYRMRRGMGIAGSGGGHAVMSTSRNSSVGTSPSGSYDAYPGDSWSVSISGALPNAQVQRARSRAGVALPDFVTVGSTDKNGDFSASGSFATSDVGMWREQWAVNNNASGYFEYNVAPALGSAGAGPIPGFDQFYQGNGYYNTIAMSPAQYAAFDAARNAAPRVPQTTVDPQIVHTLPVGPVGLLTPIGTTPQGQQIVTSSGVQNAPGMNPPVASSGDFSLSSIPWWGWAAAVGIGLYAMKGGR